MSTKDQTVGSQDGPPRAVQVSRSPKIGGAIRVPGSKSCTNRALVIAGLANGMSRISNGLTGRDSDSMVSGLRALGVDIADEGDADDAGGWVIVGKGGVGATAPVVFDADLAGTTLRFLTAMAVLSRSGVTITGRDPLLARPVGPLLDALRQCGASVHGSGADGACPPVMTTGRSGRLGGRVMIDASQSSQFVSALLLVAPYFDDGLVVEHRNLGAEGFVDLTVELMERHGVSVVATDNRLEVPAGTAYQAHDEVIAPDASAASHLFTLAVAAGGAVTVEDMQQANSQPDVGVLGVFEEFGASVSKEPDGGITVVGPDQLNPVDTDLTRMPDQLPNVAVLAALAHGTSTIRGVGVTRFHETDRIKAVAQELHKAGVAVEVGDDDVVIHGGRPRPGATFWAYHDHRMAMSLAAFAAVVGDSRIDGADAVSKTYPAFWSDAKRLGLRWTPA